MKLSTINTIKMANVSINSSRLFSLPFKVILQVILIYSYIYIYIWNHTVRVLSVGRRGSGLFLLSFNIYIFETASAAGCFLLLSSLLHMDIPQVIYSSANRYLHHFHLWFWICIMGAMQARRQVQRQHRHRVPPGVQLVFYSWPVSLPFCFFIVLKITPPG